jgi:hypothetical protein
MEYNIAFFIFSSLIQHAPFVTVFIMVIINHVPKLNYSSLLTAEQDIVADYLLKFVITMPHLNKSKIIRLGTICGRVHLDWCRTNVFCSLMFSWQ